MKQQTIFTMPQLKQALNLLRERITAHGSKERSTALMLQRQSL